MASDSTLQERLLRIDAQIKKASEEAQRYSGQLQTYADRLKALGVKDPADAPDILAALEKKIEKDKAKLASLISEMEEELDEIEGEE